MGRKIKPVSAQRAAVREVDAGLQYTLALSITITVNGSHNTITLGPLTQAVAASAPAPGISGGAAPAAAGGIEPPLSSSSGCAAGGASDTAGKRPHGQFPQGPEDVSADYDLEDDLAGANNEGAGGLGIEPDAGSGGAAGAAGGAVAASDAALQGRRSAKKQRTAYTAEAKAAALELAAVKGNIAGAASWMAKHVPDMELL
jgi:hypothetical protein